MGYRFDYSSVAINTLRRSRIKPNVLGLLYRLRALRHSPAGVHRAAVVATRRPVQRILVGDASRHMGLRGMLRCGHIPELEILLHGADDLLRRRHRLPHIRSLDRRKVLSRRSRQVIARPYHPGSLLP